MAFFITEDKQTHNRPSGKKRRNFTHNILLRIIMNVVYVSAPSHWQRLFCIHELFELWMCYIDPRKILGWKLYSKISNSTCFLYYTVRLNWSSEMWNVSAHIQTLVFVIYLLRHSMPLINEPKYLFCDMPSIFFPSIKQIFPIEYYKFSSCFSEFTLLFEKCVYSHSFHICRMGFRPFKSIQKFGNHEQNIKFPGHSGKRSKPYVFA